MGQKLVYPGSAKVANLHILQVDQKNPNAGDKRDTYLGILVLRSDDVTTGKECENHDHTL